MLKTQSLFSLVDNDKKMVSNDMLSNRRMRYGGSTKLIEPREVFCAFFYLHSGLLESITIDFFLYFQLFFGSRRIDGYWIDTALGWEALMES